MMGIFRCDGGRGEKKERGVFDGSAVAGEMVCRCCDKENLP